MRLKLVLSMGLKSLLLPPAIGFFHVFRLHKGFVLLGSAPELAGARNGLYLTVSILMGLHMLYKAFNLRYLKKGSYFKISHLKKSFCCPISEKKF
jgi:hypothetical protein